MTDLFDEVEEQLRSDRYRTLIVRALPWLVAFLAAVAIATLAYWGWDSYRRQSAAKAAEQYQLGLEAINAGRDDQAREAWSEAAKSPSAGYKSLALMQLGGMQIAQNNTAEAVDLFDHAAKAAPDEIIGDAARLKSALALLDTEPYDKVEARLKPLLDVERPYWVQAREALAFAKLMKGDVAGARGDFVIISSALDAAEGPRARAKAAIQLIDSGSAKAVPSVVKAALALPPPTPASLRLGADRRSRPAATASQRTAMTPSRRPIVFAVLLAAAIGVSGCSTLGKVNPFGKKGPKEVASEGERISIVPPDQRLEPAEALKGVDFALPAPVRLADWPLPGGTPEQSVGNVDAAPGLSVAWKRGFGQGSKRRSLSDRPADHGRRSGLCDGRRRRRLGPQRRHRRGDMAD